MHTQARCTMVSREHRQEVPQTTALAKQWLHGGAGGMHGWRAVGKMRLIGKTGVIIGLCRLVVEVLRRIGLARPLFIAACGDVGRRLGLGKRVNLETGSCLGPGRHGHGRQDEARVHSVLWALA